MPSDNNAPQTPAAPEPDETLNNMQSLSQVLFTPARSIDELKQAFALVYRTYLDRGYIAPTENQLRFGIHNLLPEATTFVAVLRETVIATATLIADSPLGLPMDQVYRDELNKLRRQDRRIAEVTMLADRRRQFRRTLPMLLALFRTTMDYAIDVLALDDLCITLNPRHEQFYRRFLCFEDLGPLKSYASVRDNPALAKRFSLRDLPALLARDKRYKALHARTDGINQAPHSDRLALTAEDVSALIPLLPDPTDVTPSARQHLAQLYGPDILL